MSRYDGHQGNSGRSLDARRPKKREGPGIKAVDFCDLKCVCASFPEEGAVDGAGSCRTFTALYCRKKRRYVHKNMPCPEKETGKEKPC
jgi:hypothetical protein